MELEAFVKKFKIDPSLLPENNVEDYHLPTHIARVSLRISSDEHILFISGNYTHKGKICINANHSRSKATGEFRNEYTSAFALDIIDSYTVVSTDHNEPNQHSQ